MQQSLEITSFLKQKRPKELFPQDERLPWHFSYIDDQMIGGMSVPCEHFNYKALVNEGVGLIVNLTESLVGFSSTVECSECEYCPEDEYDSDLLRELEENDSLHMLSLPMRDGHVPSFDQVQKFLDSANETISKGLKVMVHCHAGVGRTGMFLAIYLMEKYKITPEEAIMKLRHQRPHSMQFNPDDWFNNPFLIRRSDAYERNLYQERFVHLYYKLKIAPELEKSLVKADIESKVNDIASDAKEESLSDKSIDAKGLDTPSDEKEEKQVDEKAASEAYPTPEGSEYSDEGISDIESIPETSYVYKQKHSIEFIDQQLSHMLNDLSFTTKNVPEYSPSACKSKCLVCQQIISIGPIPLYANVVLSPNDIVYKC